MNDAENGQEGAHTPRAPGGAAAAAPGAAAQEQPAADLFGVEAEAMIAGSPDVSATDMLSVAAELVARERRGRGRPAGSPHRRNGEMFRYLESLGHRHPAVTLSMIQNADTRTLARLLGTVAVNDDGVVQLDGDGRPVIVPADPLDVLKVQAKAAADLLPFDLAKKVHIDTPPDRPRPVMFFGDVSVTQVSASGLMSAGEAPPDKIIDNQ